MTRTRIKTAARLLAAGACLWGFLAVPASAGETEDRLEALGVFHREALPQSRAVLEAAVSDAAEAAAAQAREKIAAGELAGIREWIAGPEFASLALAARERVLLTLAQETPLPQGSALFLDADKFRGLMEDILAAPPSAKVLVPGCRKHMPTPLFRYDRVAHARLVELNELQEWSELERGARNPSDWLQGAVSAEGVSSGFRRRAVDKAFERSGGQGRFVYDAWRRVGSKESLGWESAEAFAYALARAGAVPNLLWMVERGERAVLGAGLQELEGLLANPGAGIDVPAAGARLFEIAKARPEAAGAIYSALPLGDAPDWAILGLTAALSEARSGSEAAKALGDTQSDVVARFLGQLGREALASPKEDTLEQAKNIVLALRLMDTEVAAAELRTISAAPVPADAPDADKLATIQRKAVANL